MRCPHLAIAALLATLTAPVVAAPAAPRSSPAAIEAHVRFLADDLLEGRETGSRGHEIAAAYAAAQFRALGLLPAGDAGSYFQRVPLLSGVRVKDGARLALKRDGRSVEFKFLDEFLPGVNYNAEASEVVAPLVFVGYAVHAPELGYDDFAGVDLKGKIAVYLADAPASFPGTERAVHASSLEKLRGLVEAGAIGAIGIRTPEDERKYPWARAVRNWERPGMRLVDAQGAPLDSFPALKASASLNSVAAARLFDGALHSFDDVLGERRTGKPRSFDLPGVATIAVRERFERVVSRNVAARLPGADPALAGESVVFTAHLDHLGIGAEVNGDRIYNGALDNALGSAILLEVARQMRQSVVPPRRSAVFVLVTAEEKGLLGAQWFATHPPASVGTLVADVNMDMPVMLTELSDVVSIGTEHSTLGGVVAAAAREVGLTISPDPFPEEVVFVRSDQYPFVRQGIPSVFLDAGYTPVDPRIDGRKLQQEFLQQHYHQPSDQADLPIDYRSAARLADLNLRIGLMVANRSERPRWNDGDFLGRKFGGK